jgi:hypothetical protein
MPEIVYLLCAITSLTCTILLGRAYWHSRVKLLLWSAVCFAALALTNSLLFVDLVILSDSISLQPLRNGITVAGLVLMLYGLIFEEK